MLLYHYTGHFHLPKIKEEGLSRGEVPLSDRRVLNAVNLTSDPQPIGHGLDGGGTVVSEQDSAKILTATGSHIPAGTRFANKRAVRITVKVPSSDRNLKRWLPWARKHIAADYLARLHAAAGSGKEKTWWLYFGTIPPSAFVAVDILEPDED